MSKDALKGSADRLSTMLYRRSEQNASNVPYVSVLDGIQQVSEGDSDDRDSRRGILMDRW
jgi:RecA-family ATPase